MNKYVKFKQGLATGTLQNVMRFLFHFVCRDTILVSFANCLTSFFSGFVVFSLLGYMSNTLGQDVSELAASDSDLAFITYPEIVTHLPLSQLWSVLFFLLLIILAIDTQVM